jgi:hypothetical protein
MPLLYILPKDTVEKEGTSDRSILNSSFENCKKK